MDVRAPDLGALARALKDAGAKDLQRELGKGINRAVRPVKDALKESAGTLPERGGLAGDVAKSKFATRRSNSRKSSGVRVQGRGRYSLYHLNEGIVRHPVKGGRPTVQRITPGWWDRPIEQTAPAARRELVAAIDEVARKIERAA